VENINPKDTLCRPPWRHGNVLEVQQPRITVAGLIELELVAAKVVFFN